MRKTLFFLFALCAMYVSAQVTTDPGIIYQDYTGQVVIKYDPTLGNGGMADADRCFAHTGLITSASKNTGDWKHVKSEWRAENTPELSWNAEDNVWELVIPNIYTFYGASEDEVIYDLAFVFHDGLGGSKEGKTALEGDILVPVKEVINHTYTVNLYTPSTCPDMKPAILGMFNDWSENVPMNAKYDEYERLYYSYTYEDREGHEIKFREVNDKSKNWDNQIWHANYTTLEWDETPNILLGTEDVITVDYSDNSRYMYGLCRQTFMPTNAKAVQNANKVTFSWDEPENMTPYMYVYWYDDDYQIYGSYQFSSGQTSYTAVFSNAEDMKLNWGFQAYTDDWFSITYQNADPFVLKASPYIPHDLMAIPEGDGSYMLSWMMDETEEVANYGIWLHRIDGGYSISTSVQGNMQFKTDMLGLSGKYAYEVRVRDAQGYTMGVGYDTIEVKPVEERDLLVRVLLQPGVSGVTATRFVDASQSMEMFALEAEKENKGWYRATLRSAHPALPINLSYEYYSGSFQISKDTCFEVLYSSGIYSINCDAKRQDFSPKNLKVVSVGDGKADFEWEWGDDVPNGYQVGTFHEDSAGWWFYTDYNNPATSQAMPMPAEEQMKVLWSITPIVSGQRLTEFQTYGEPFMVEKSTTMAHNLKATPNGDGSFTLSWDKIESSSVSYWGIRFIQAGGGDNTYYYGDMDIHSYLTDPLSTLGTYTVYVYTYNEKDECIGASSCNFEVKLVPEYDIVVKLLVHPDVPMGVPTCKYDSIDGTTAYVTPKVLGDYWYSYTIHTDKPMQYVTFGGSYSLYLAKDTCLEYTPNGDLNQIACDAKAHDYRILEESLKATVYAGRVVFEWAAKDESDTYSLGLYDSETGEQVSGSEFNASKSKTYEMAIVDALDGKQVYWAVAPSSPYYLSYVSNDQKLTLKKSGVELTELKADTKDNKSFAFSWKSNTDTVQYVISIFSIDHSEEIICDTIQECSYAYTFPIDGQYQWTIRPLTKKAEVLGQWIYGAVFTVKDNKAALENLTGEVKENKMVFEWEGAAPYFVAYLYYRPNGNYGFNYLGELVTESHTASITLDGDGDYAAVVYPMLTKTKRMEDFLQLVVPYFAPSETPMYHVSITAEEGGQLGIEYVGDYPKGFVFDVYVYSINEGYKFIGWSDGVTVNSRSITLVSDTTITAKFAKKDVYKVTAKAGEGGRIYVGSDVEAKKEIYIFLDEGSYTTLTAIGDPGYSFYQWSNGRTESSIYVYPNSDTTLTAEFKKFCYVKLSATEGGSAKLLNAKDYDYDEEKGAYVLHYGEQINIKAVPTDGYRFVKWSDNDENVNRTLTVTADLNLQAQFEKVEKPLAKYTVRLLSNNTNLGTVNSQVNGTYFEGDKVTITATPNVNANFLKWSDGVAETTRTIVVSQDTTLTAMFEVKTFHVSIKAGEHGSLGEEVDGTYEYGAYIDVYAVPDEHYHFVNWSDGYTDSYRYMYVYEDIDLTANFAIDQFLITFLDEDGSFLESNWWDYGSTPSCSFDPIKPEDEFSWYTFKGWDPAIEPVTEDKRYYAVYEVHEKTLGIDAVGETEPARKIYRDGQIYILRGEKIYTVQGQLVK